MMNSNFIIKFLLVLLISILSFNFLSAQDYYASRYTHKRVSLGLAFSPNVSWLCYGNRSPVDKKAEFGYAYGLLSDFSLAENYAFCSGFLMNNLKASSNLNP